MKASPSPQSIKVCDCFCCEMSILQEDDVIILISNVMHHVPSFFLISDASAVHGHDPNFIGHHNLAATYVEDIAQSAVSTPPAVDKCRTKRTLCNSRTD